MKKVKTRISLRVLSLALALMMLLGAATALASCSSDGLGAINYIKIISGGKKLEMKVAVSDYEINQAYVFALDPWQSILDIPTLKPIAECKVKNGTVDIKLDIEGDIATAVSKGYVLAKKNSGGYTAISGVYYVTNARDLHKKAGGNESDSLGTLKGAVGTTSQLLSLGASSTVVTVDIGKLLAPDGGVGRISHVWNGYTVFVDRDQLEILDRTVKGYSDSGIRVFLEIVQSSPFSALPAGVRNIAYAGVSGAEGYALNMSEREGAVRICGLFDLIAERYTSGEYGIAESLIIGRNVNNYKKYYAGADSLEQSVKNYVSAVRAAYSILMSHTPTGRVYIAVDNNWSVANYNVREFLSTVANISREGGDFYWQIAIEANASDASLSSIWADGLTVDPPEFISPANIHVLSSLLSSGQYTCNGKKRNILVNRFVVGGSDEEARAASYAYAFYKCLETKCVDGLIYGKMADLADDTITGGLLTAESGGRLSERKLIADVFASIDNTADGGVNDIAARVGSTWDGLYKEYRKQIIRRSVSAVGDTGEHSGKNIKIHADFSNGDLFGFAPAASSDFVELRYSSLWQRPALFASLTPASRSDSAGVVSGNLKLKDLKNAGYLGIIAMATGSEGELVDITVRLSGYGKNGVRQELVCSARATSGSWFELYYDIEDFVKELKSDDVSIAVLAAPSSGDGSVDSLWISQISTESPIHTGMPVWLIVVLIVAAVGGALTGFIIWFTKNYTFVRE